MQGLQCAHALCVLWIRTMPTHWNSTLHCAGNEVIKLMTGKDCPIVNVFILDAMGFNGGAVFSTLAAVAPTAATSATAAPADEFVIC